jgi:hypothetical protein
MEDPLAEVSHSFIGIICGPKILEINNFELCHSEWLEEVSSSGDL